MITPKTAVADIGAVAAHYDDLDPFYRMIWGTQLHHGYWETGNESTDEAILNLTRRVAQEARMAAGVRVCDIGCGYGAAATIFAREYGARVTGVTLSKKQYEFAQSASSGAAEIDFLLGDGLDNRLAGESFDSVVAIESSEHMQDKPRFFAEANRLLRSHGRLVVAAWLTRERPYRCESKYLLEPICVEGRLPNLATAAEYLTMLARSGFRDIVFHDLTHGVRKTWSVCALRIIIKVLPDPTLRRRLFDADFSNRVFAKAVPRVWLAYRIGSMRYGLFSGVK